MTELHMTAPPEAYRQRRAKLASAMSRPLVLFAGTPRARHYPTNTYPFRAGSNYLYFGGPPVPGGALLIEPGSDGTNGCALFRPTVGFDDIVWTGEPPGDEALLHACGIGAHDLLEPDALAVRLAGRPAGYLAPPCPSTMFRIGSLPLQPATTDALEPIINLRLTKDEHELAAMRYAARVAVDGHLAAMKTVRPGGAEADAAAALTAAFVRNRCHHSFSPIITVNGEILHSEVYPNPLEEGRLLLVDAGAEEPGGYASDITRSYPVNGTFTPIQRQLYDTVLRAQLAAIDACVPGRRYRDIHDLAARVICEGLIEAGLLHGNADDLLARSAHALFFTHGLGHLIGLDVHDMEDFGDLAGYAPGRTRRTEFGNKFLRLDHDLAPDMTVTIEPGIYVVPAIWRNEDFLSPFADCIKREAVERLIADRFGGIRIEDTIRVRCANDPGPEVLTDGLPKSPDDLAAIVGSGM